MDKGWTVHALAVHLGVSDRTIERWYAAGKIPEPDLHRQNDSAKMWSTEQVRKIRAWHLENLRRGA